MVFDEFKDKKNILSLISAIRKISNDNYRIMEVCGGQTHSIVKYGIEDLLPDNVTLIHGPGCPVCVTPEAMIDKAIELSNNPGCIICTFGDMMRVPGSEYSLSYSKTKGNDIRIVYSPLDAIKIAKDNPIKEIVFWGIGFETTAPIYSLLIEKIISSEIKNMSVLTSLVTVPAAIRNLLSDEECNINGLLGAGHVCAISGFNQYESIARQFNIPISITGFEPFDLLWGIYNCIDMINNKNYIINNSYSRIVNKDGNLKALEMLNNYFEITDYEWRGLGVINNSGLKLKKKYELYDATCRFNLKKINNCNCRVCPSGDILKGKLHPKQCDFFGKDCTPEHPIGVSMVSTEGACSAFYRYK